MKDKILYNRLPKKYQRYGDMPNQYEMQECIDNFMLYSNTEERKEWEQSIKYAI